MLLPLFLRYAGIFRFAVWENQLLYAGEIFLEMGVSRHGCVFGQENLGEGAWVTGDFWGTHA
jgi:hypothetical protein